jgi:hypothetical protein
VFRRFKPLTLGEEADRILKSPRDFELISAALDRQFHTIHNHAQLLLGICGVLITASVLVTSGRLTGRPLFLYRHFAGALLLPPVDWRSAPLSSSSVAC